MFKKLKRATRTPTNHPTSRHPPAQPTAMNSEFFLAATLKYWFLYSFRFFCFLSIIIPLFSKEMLDYACLVCLKRDGILAKMSNAFLKEAETQKEK